MKRLATRGATVVACCLCMGAQLARAQGPDSTVARIAAMVSRGDRQGANAVADSLVKVTPPESPTYAEALYWRAFAAANAAEAERDYLRVAIEYPLSQRAEDALLLLSQLEFARGDRSSAIRHLDRLRRDHPTGRNVGRASFWTARIAFETGDTLRACSALSAARAQLPEADIETRNQVDYFAPRCAPRTAEGANASASVSGKAAAATPSPTSFSLQVAAFKTRREADTLARGLRRRGFDVRVSHQDSWYRVRIGRYATRELATQAQARARASKVTTRIVEAEKP